MPRTDAGACIAKSASPHTLLALHLGAAHVWRPVLVATNGCAAYDSRLAAAGIIGGTIYDGILAFCALKANAETILYLESTALPAVRI